MLIYQADYKQINLTKSFPMAKTASHLTGAKVMERTKRRKGLFASVIADVAKLEHLINIPLIG